MGPEQRELHSVETEAFLLLLGKCHSLAASLLQIALVV